jgi:formylglycine-generating enzyme required for sulfatase activity
LYVFGLDSAFGFMKGCALRLLAAVCLSWVSSCLGVSIQPRLALDTVSGLSITGAVGSAYTIQYSTNLAANSWRPLTIVNLATTNKAWISNSMLPKGPVGFYRAVLGAPSPTNMVLITPGTFTQGSPATEFDRFNDEGPQTVVTFTRTFYAALHPVSQAEYQAVTGVNPSFFTGDSSRPVDQVSWNDATNYCALLTQLQLTAGRIPVGWQYRLPTEAEWEYVCRAGTTNRFYYGDDLDYSQLPNYAWFFDNSGSQTHPSGLKPANPWGLYDMSGNVWEWCLDWYGPYPGGNVTDPLATDSTSGIRTLRGGSWQDDGRFCRSAYRSADTPTVHYNFYGFRIVLAPAN